MTVRHQEYSNEKEVIEGCVKRDSRAQRILYDSYSSRLFTVALRYAGDRERAKDILHDGFITVFEKIGSYNGSGSFEGWLRRIFVNTALMALRKADVLKNCGELNSVAGEFSSNPSALDEISSKELLKVISSMPDGFRMVFNMFAIEGYSHQEIAQELNISESSSRSQLSRARGWLQERIRR